MRCFAGAMLLVSLSSLAQSQNSTSGVASTASASPTCIQPRQPFDPPLTSISIALTGAIPTACDTTQQEVVTSSTLSLTYYKFGSYFFNISHPINVVNSQQSEPSFCSASFNSLVSVCINAPNLGFWGGWIISSGTNYSISNFIYPANPLPSEGARSGSSASSLSGSAARLSAAPYAESSSATLPRPMIGTGAGPSSALPSTTPPFPIRSSQLSSGGGGTFVTVSGTGGFLSSTAVRTGGPQSISTVVAPLPLPSLATIITGTVGSQVVTETFVPHIFPQYTTISGTITTTTTLTSGSSPVTVVVGPNGVGWAPYHEPSDASQLLPPSILPPSAVAAADSADPTVAGVSSASVPLGTGVTTPSVPSGTGISTSDPSANTSSHQSSIGTGSSFSSILLSTGNSAPSLSSSGISPGTGFRGSSLLIIGSSAQNILTGSTDTFGTISQTTQPVSISKSASQGASTNAAIVPISYVTTAFNSPSQTITTLSISGQAAVVYNKETFPGLSTITAPTTIQTSVVETEKNGKTSTFIGGIVVGPGGVYWGPPGLPPIPPFPGISPPCIWPFCTGGGGGGGSDPPGDPQPPPPYTPDDPNTPDNNDPKTQDQPSGKSSQPFSTPKPSSSSNPSSASQSPVTSSESCSSHTVTDYWVSCASGASTSCSTYASSVISGCSVTAATSTTASACPLGAYVSADPTMAGFDYSNEYPVLNPGYSSDVQWTYTVADIVESGVVVGSASASAGPSDSANSSPTTGTITPSGADNTATPGSGASTMPILTTTNLPSSTSGGNSAGMTSSPSAASVNPICQNFADPDNGVAGECQCSSGTFYTKLPLLTGQSDHCGYTSFPSPSPTPTPTSNPNPYPFTYTDIENGNVIACKSSSIGNAGVLYTVCEGESTTIGTDSAIYDHYTSAEAAAASASAAAAKPTAHCAFWDEVLYWTFEVYNINGWAGNDGGGLHKQEKGCGDLTGWSWTAGDIGNDQHVYFNLPFTMKSGCVERAIASAGGPSGLSCSGKGVGKERRSLKLESEQKNPKRRRRFRTDVSFSLSNRGVPELQALQNLKREAFLEIKPPSIVERDITPAPYRLNARSEFEKLYELDSRDLIKRGCLDWIWPGKNIPEEWWCNAVIPGVDACIAEIQKKGVVGKYPSMFYTSWGGIGDGSFGVEGTKLWASQNICSRVVDFDGITVGVYQYVVESAVLKPFGKDGLNLPEDEQKQILDPFLKNLSQAFAEQSAGEAYVFVPKGIDFQPNSAWTGWEYPALTRNKEITIIYKVELDYSDPKHFIPPDGKPQGVKTVLWTKGDPPSATEPKGTRRGTLPAQIPQDQIPADWQSSI